MYDNNIDNCEHNEVFQNPIDNCTYCADCCEMLNNYGKLEELDD